MYMYMYVYIYVYICIYVCIYVYIYDELIFIGMFIFCLTVVTKSTDGASETTSSPSSEVDKDSPPPLWEQAKPMPSSQGRQLPVQAKHPDQPVGSRRASKNSSKSSQFPEPSGAAAGNAGNRPSSYSKAVAGAAINNGPDLTPAPQEGKKKTKLVKTKSMPEKMSAFTAVGDSIGHPGK